MTKDIINADGITINGAKEQEVEMFYSCTCIKKVVKKHRTRTVALKNAGEYGQIMDIETGKVWQSNQIANGTFRGFSDVDTEWSIIDFVPGNPEQIKGHLGTHFHRGFISLK